MATIEERAIDKYPITAENGDRAIEMRKLYVATATEQKAIDIVKLKDVMNSLMLDTQDKAEIIKAMEE